MESVFPARILLSIVVTTGRVCWISTSSAVEDCGTNKMYTKKEKYKEKRKKKHIIKGNDEQVASLLEQTGER